MNELTPQQQVYENFKEWYRSYLYELSEMNPQEIISCAKDKVIFESLLACFEDNSYLTDREATLMLEQDYTLRDVYEDWEEAGFVNTDVLGSIMGDMLAEHYNKKFAEPLTLTEQLQEKLETEYKAFSEELSSKSVDEVITRAYEKVIKEELVTSAVGSCYHNEEYTNLLLSEDNLLSKLYDSWLASNYNVSQVFEDFVGDYSYDLKEELKKELKSADNKKPSFDEQMKLAEQKANTIYAKNEETKYHTLPRSKNIEIGD